MLLQEFIWCKQGAVAPKQTWGPLIFISKFKFLYYEQSIGKVWEKSQCRFHQWNDLRLYVHTQYRITLVKKLRYLSANVSFTGSLSSIETYSGKKKECKLILNASVHGCDHHSNNIISQGGHNTIQGKKTMAEWWNGPSCKYRSIAPKVILTSLQFISYCFNMCIMEGDYTPSSDDSRELYSTQPSKFNPIQV